MTAAPPPHVTEAERVLLEALWRQGPLTPPRLLAEVQAGRDWADTTVKTLLGRLMRKGAVRAERESGRLVYRAVLGRDAHIAAEVQDLVDRLFDGDRAALAAYLASTSVRTSGT